MRQHLWQVWQMVSYIPCFSLICAENDFREIAVAATYLHEDSNGILTSPLNTGICTLFEVFLKSISTWFHNNRYYNGTYIVLSDLVESSGYSSKTLQKEIMSICASGRGFTVLKKTKTHISSYFHCKVFIIENNQWKFEQNQEKNEEITALWNLAITRGR